MNCAVCGGKLRYIDGKYVCENCGLQQSLSLTFESTEVFICYIENDAYGRRSKDSVIAQNIYNKLEDTGIRSFYKRISVGELSEDEAEMAATAAFDKARVVAVVATDPESFRKLTERYGEKLKTKKVIPVFSGMNVNDMPTELKSLQAINYDAIGSVEDLIKNALKLLDRESDISVISEMQNTKKRRKKVAVLSSVICLIIALLTSAYIVFCTPYILKNKKYDYAAKLVENKDYIKAISIYTDLGDYNNSVDLLNRIYDKYNGYYENLGVSIHINIDNNLTSNIDIIRTIDNKRYIINISAVIQEDVIDFIFKDNYNESGIGKIKLNNDYINLALKTGDESESGEININFELPKKSDKPLVEKINKNKIISWLSQAMHESDFINQGYYLNFYDNVYKSQAIIKRIANTDIYVAIFNDLPVKVAGMFVEYQHVDDGVVLAIQGPADIVCPQYIDKSLDSIESNDVLYMPEQDFLDIDGEIGFTKNGSEISALINENKSYDKYIHENTIVSLTSKNWITEKNWDKIVKSITECNEYNDSGKDSLYRVRKSANDSASQIGAYKILENAKKDADAHKAEGYKVYDDNGKVIYEP